ncbi:MAG: c-type cytochrome [Bacteroidia bacterium]|nr:c-type cytochrome [Bacteroidia bacterium]
MVPRTTTYAVVAAFVLISAFAVSCGSGGDKPTENTTTPSQTNAAGTPKPGMIQPSDVTLGALDAAVAEKGKTTYDVKCQACHSLESNRVVGPGWKGITTRREPHWILNMAVNTDAMLADDPEAQKQLEECLVRMPNQGLSKTEAREVLEFMRQNDGVK